MARAPIKSDLEIRLSQDKELAKDKELQALFLSYAVLYDSDLLENLQRTSFELDEKYVTLSPQTWFKFLKYPIVKKYIDGFLEESAEKMAQLTLAERGGNTKDALTVQKQIEEKRKANDNASYIVMFMPQRKLV